MEPREWLANSSAAPPTRPVAPSTGYPQGGVTPTKPGAYWYHQITEELRALVAAAGVALDATVLTQLRQAIKRLTGGNVTTVNFAVSPFALTADGAGLVIVDASAGNVVLNLPAANVFAALRFQIKRIDATANTVTINRAGADTIDGATNVTLPGQGATAQFVSDGVSQWQTVQTPRGMQRFTVNSNFTGPPGVTTIYVSGCAGGGAGGGGGCSQITGSYVGGNGGGGGAGQSVIRQPYIITPGQVLAVVIGAGGAAGAAGVTGGVTAGTGGAGGTTSLGALLTLAGGSGGTGGNSTASVGLGGAGGAGYPAGSVGSNVADGSLATGPSGVGASGPFGGAGGAVRASSNPSAGASGGAAGGYGSGGAGGAGQVLSSQSYAGGAGGAGAPGILIVEW